MYQHYTNMCEEDGFKVISEIIRKKEREAESRGKRKERIVRMRDRLEKREIREQGRQRREQRAREPRDR